jgi:hypothetical protein
VSFKGSLLIGLMAGLSFWLGRVSRPPDVIKPSFSIRVSSPIDDCTPGAMFMCADARTEWKEKKKP